MGQVVGSLVVLVVFVLCWPLWLLAVGLSSCSDLSIVLLLRLCFLGVVRIAMFSLVCSVCAVKSTLLGFSLIK